MLAGESGSLQPVAAQSEKLKKIKKSIGNDMQYPVTANPIHVFFLFFFSVVILAFCFISTHQIFLITGI